MARAWVWLAVWAGFASAAGAQITGMATTDDGSVLYFATALNLLGSRHPATARIYVCDAGGLRVYADRFPGAAPPNTVLSNPWVSGDGSVVAYRGTYTAGSGTQTLTAIQRGSGAPMVLNSAAVLSANGQYALIPGPALLDLTSGAETGIPQPPPYDNVLLEGVASDGTVLVYNLGLSLLDTWRPGAIQYIAAGTAAAVMDDAADTVVYVQDGALYLYDLASGNGRLFANGTAPSISRDGQWVAFLSPMNGVAQAWAVPADQSGYWQLTDEPLGATAAIVSGSGNVVYAATATNAIWKYDLASGTATRILPHSEQDALREAPALWKLCERHGPNFF